MYAVLSAPAMCRHIQLPVWQSYLASGQTSYTDVVGSEAVLFNVFLGNGTSYQNNVSSVSGSARKIKRSQIQQGAA